MPSIAPRPVRDGAERERLEARSVLTACAHCSDSFEGTLAAGRSWFAEHRMGASRAPSRSSTPPHWIPAQRVAVTDGGEAAWRIRHAFIS